MLAVVHSSISGGRTGKTLHVKMKILQKFKVYRTFASNSVGRGGQSTLAGTQVTAWCVSAFATVTDTWILFALIDVSAASSVHQQHVTSTEIRKRKMANNDF